MLILFKYYADVENCESFKGFGYIYIYIYIDYLAKNFMIKKSCISQYTSSKRTHIDLKNLPSDYWLQKMISSYHRILIKIK